MADTTSATSHSSAPSLAAPAVEPISPVSTPRTAGGITALASATELLRPSSPRKRERTPENPAAAAARSTSPVSPKTLVAAPQALTGAAEMAEQLKEAKRRKIAAEKDAPQPTSDNPSAKAVSALMGLDNGMSRPEDAPDAAAHKLSEPLAAIAPSITATKGQTQEAANALTSPVSTASAATTEGASMLLASTARGVRVASPAQVEEERRASIAGASENPNRSHTMDAAGAKSMTYPGPLLSTQLEGGRRNLSLDSGMQREGTKSPSSNKKHKCPYCATEFTRHHNLKSHLLTHSHEKPYLCKECDSRFRRLHDLKRHMKLHTGERPHVCPKCKRSFARGDALARHNKGQGGCAGRRSSTGSFGPDGGEEPIEGMIYTTGDASQEPEHMDEDSDMPADRGSNVPSIRHHDAPDQPSRSETQNFQQRQSSSYPPVAARAPMGSSLYPPNTPHGVPSGPQSPTIASSAHGSYPPPAYGGATAYGQPPMTESPKPLSPGQPMPPGDTRNRSPSLSHQLTASAFGRRQNSRTDPALPPPPSHTNAPTLPPPPGMNIPPPPDTRYSVGPTAGVPQTSGSSSYQPQGGSFPAPGNAGSVHNSASNSLSSHGTGQPGSGERAGLPYANDDRMWAFVRNLEVKIDRLESEVGSLRQQLQHYQQGQPHPLAAPPAR